MLTVEKIGGTSMSRFGEILDHVILGKRKGADVYGRIFVVSAYAHVTNWLLEHKKSGENGVYSLFAKQADHRTALRDLLGRLKEINAGFEKIGLPLAKANAYLEERIARTENFLESMANVLATGYVNRESILLAAREILASIGEAHAAFNSTEILKSRGVNALFVDLGGFEDSDYITIDDRIRKSFQGIDFSKTLPLVTGYTKGTEGIMREFDRGYTEITFCKIAVEVKASEAVIHKEYHLSSADPGIVGTGSSVVVGFTNFDVADQLADVGMEAIHPKAAKPLELAGIQLRVKNAFEPDHPGTLITKEYICPESRVEIIAGTPKVEVVEIHDPSMVGEVGFDRQLMEIFERHGVSYILKATNANSISHVLWEKAVTDELISELGQLYSEVTVRDVAMVCAIGSNIAKPGILYTAAQALAEKEVNVLCVSQSLRQTNMQFVVERKDYENAVRALNQALCLKK